jgi:glycosidase
MKARVLLSATLLLLFGKLAGQVITCNPAFPIASNAVTITFNADQGNAALKDYSGTVYAHMGLITSLSAGPSSWKHVVTTWGVDDLTGKMTRVSANVYTITITPSIKAFFGVTDETEIVQKLAFVFRNLDGSKQGKTEAGGDIFYDVSAAPVFKVLLTLPDKYTSLVNAGDNIPIAASASAGDSLILLDNNTRLTKVTALTASYTVSAAGTGLHKIVARAWDNNVKLEDSAFYFIKPAVVVEDAPVGMKAGVNITGDNSVTFLLYAPGKDNVFVTGDFNNWLFCDAGYMKRSIDGKWFWLDVAGLDPAKEYGFQYVIDGDIRIPDPYTTKILDPDNDKYIESTTYPDLKEYPTGLASGLVAVFQTRPAQYTWENTSFTAPAKEKLIIYELLVRDFTGAHDFKTVLDSLDYLSRLGVNAVEFMPVAEFEGNSSWGYNPSMYFAVDKYYGPADSFRELIDSCHSRGIAVIMDMVLNHAYGSNPLVRMYYNPTTYKVTEDNPWFNVKSPNSAYSWGYDFNHESTETKAFVDSVNHYWINEFKIDGFRFDFTKGFTNTISDGMAYDASRIAILKRMADKIRVYKPDAHLILEHFTANTEEKELSAYGFMLWGDGKGQYQEASMGFSSSFSEASYKNLGWGEPGVLDYMESHDEERLMYKDYMWGNTSGDYSVRNFETAIRREKLCAAFFFTMPGPKMIWQFEEVGYDSTKTKHGNVGEMPVMWEYYDVEERRNLYNNFAALINLKKNYETFSSSDYTLYEAGKQKRLNIIQADMDAVVIGNFDVITGVISANFSKTGTWYEFFSGKSIDVTADNINQVIDLAPGEYKLYTSKQIPRPSFLTSVNELPVAEPGGAIFTIYPNPFFAETKIKIADEEWTDRTIEVYSTDGNLVKIMTLPAGIYEKVWDGRNNSGKKIPPGIYIIRINTGGKYSFGKVILR